MLRWTFAAIASLALVATGLVHGFWTDRWTVSNDTVEAASRLDKIPLSFGDWDGEEIAVKPGQVAPGVSGSVQRRYVNRVTQGAVVIALVNGRPGPVATHTPEVCYGASGYRVDAKNSIGLDTKATSAQFWTSRAVKTSATSETRIRLYWAWNAGQGWVASKDARQEFPRFVNPILHKLYVVRDLVGVEPPRSSGKDVPERDDVCESFLKAFLPELDPVLFTRG